MNQTTQIRAALRKLARYMPQKKECLRNSIHPTEKGPRGGALFICNHCGLCFKGIDIEVDHIEPVVPINQEGMDWNTYIARLFCDISNLQVLCKECHRIKTNRENEERI